MKIKLTTILILFALVSAVLAGAFLEQFHARSEGENVKLEWKTGQESNVVSYAIERRTPQTDNFTEITTIKPKGDNSFYSYLDQSAYKTNNVIFIYRLKIVAEQVSYSKEVSVSPNISGVKRTWGSIKAMFR